MNEIEVAGGNDLPVRNRPAPARGPRNKAVGDMSASVRAPHSQNHLMRLPTSDAGSGVEPHVPATKIEREQLISAIVGEVPESLSKMGVPLDDSALTRALGGAVDRCRDRYKNWLPGGPVLAERSHHILLRRAFVQYVAEDLVAEQIDEADSATDDHGVAAIRSMIDRALDPVAQSNRRCAGFDPGSWRLPTCREICLKARWQPSEGWRAGLIGLECIRWWMVFQDERLVVLRRSPVRLAAAIIRRG